MQLKKISVAIGLFGAALVAQAIEMPNPLMRPPQASSYRAQEGGLPNLPPLESSRQGQGSPQASETKVQRPSFDGWAVSFVTDDFAVLRMFQTQSVSAKPAAGAPGFGTGEAAPVAATMSSVGSVLEFENGETVAIQDSLIKATIRNGRVVLTYVGSALSSYRTSQPVIVFSGSVSSQAVALPRIMEKRDDRYISINRPAANTARTASGGGGGAIGAAPGAQGAAVPAANGMTN